MTRDIALRRIPYPYRAMAAIANDIDEATWDDFLHVHEFLNTGRLTALGRGLDLEVADSFFFYGTTSAEKNPTFTYFEGVDSRRRAPWADQMDVLIQAGYLDSLHTWGDFSRTGGFQRDLALDAAGVLHRHGCVRVWINHGDERNEQKAGRPGWDDPAAPHGHADIATACGLRYFWVGTITSVVGQDAAESWRDRFQPQRLLNEVVRPIRRAAVRDLNMVRFFGNRLMKPAIVAGRDIQIFQRYGFWGKPTACDLAEVLSSAVLDTLESRRGVMAVYTHLFRRPAGMPLERVDWSPLAELARRHRDGRIQVTTTSRLLRYSEAAATLTWTTDRHNGVDTIRLAPQAAPDTLQGITFYVPDPDRVVVTAGDRELPLERNPPDDSGRRSVSVPWQALIYPFGAVVDAARAGAPESRPA